MYTVYSSHDHFNENTTLSIPTNFFVHVKLIKANTLSFFLLKTRRKQK